MPPDADGDPTAELAELWERVRHLEGRLDEERAARRRSEEAAQAALRRLAETDRAKSVFLASISHELRTPLTAIAGFASLLHNDIDKFTADQVTDFVARISRNAETLHQMIEEVLDFARLDQDDVVVRVRPVDLSEIVASTIDALARPLAQHDVRVACAPGVHVLAEARPIQRILSIVLQNAAQYSPQDTPITVSVDRPQPGRVRVLVDDCGPGVPPDERERVFEAFYRGPHPHVIQTHGPGIGLTVARRFLDAMDGAIVMEESPVGGARVRIDLQAAPAVDGPR